MHGIWTWCNGNLSHQVSCKWCLAASTNFGVDYCYPKHCPKTVDPRVNNFVIQFGLTDFGVSSDSWDVNHLWPPTVPAISALHEPSKLKRPRVSTDLPKICHCIVFFPSYNTTQIQRKNTGSSWSSFTQHVFFKPYVQGRITPVIWEGSLDPNGIAFWKGELRLHVYTKHLDFHVWTSADHSRRQGERIRGAARKTGAEARTAKFEAGTWARKNARAWPRKKRKNHEEGNPIRKVACRFKKMEAQEPRTGQFEVSFLSGRK